MDITTHSYWVYQVLRQLFENGEFEDRWLVGHSGYTLKNWLMTPLTNPTTVPQRKFNKSIKKQGAFIECSFGVLKSRWCILYHSGGHLYYISKSGSYHHSMLCFAQYMSAGRKFDAHWRFLTGSTC